MHVAIHTCGGLQPKSRIILANMTSLTNHLAGLTGVFHHAWLMRFCGSYMPGKHSQLCHLKLTWDDSN